MKFSTDRPEPLDLFDVLFYRNLAKSLVKKAPTIKLIETYSDDVQMKIPYERNSYGYRGNDFGNNEEIMVLGCSQTFGRGLPEEFTWANVFSNKLNKNYVNLAQEGDSAQAQIYKAFKYFEEFGNPKIIVACLPSTRIEMPYISKKFGKDVNKFENDWTDLDKIQQIFLYNELDKYSKMPHDPEKILPMEFAIFYSFMFIQMLEQYCKTNNIVLIWSMWDDYLFYDYLKTNMPNILNNYLHIAFNNFVFDDEKGIEYVKDLELNDGTLIIPQCHQELKNHKLFYRAADYDPGIINGHWGIHLNQHIAEDFYSEYLNRINSEKK